MKTACLEDRNCAGVSIRLFEEGKSFGDLQILEKKQLKEMGYTKAQREEMSDKEKEEKLLNTCYFEIKSAIGYI